MSRPFFLVVLAIVIGALVSIPVAGQAPAAQTPTTAKPAPPTSVAKTPTWTPPKTAWGDPDLQGIYNYATSTPLQRFRDFSDKAVLSDEEAAALQEQLRIRINTDNTPRDRVGNYNDHWMDPLRKELTKDKRTSLIIDPPDGRIPPRVPPTPEQLKEAANIRLMNQRFNAGFMESYLDGDVGNRCIIRRRNEGGGHPYLPAIYNNMAQIFQTPGYVVIYAEMIHFSRIIPVDARPHLSQRVKTWYGDPRGHWEGNTLVVETTNFRSDDSMGRPLGRTGVVYGGGNAETYKITERWTRVDAETLHYTFTIDDPQTWTRPWTAMIPWNKTTDQIYEYACGETNYDVYHWLSSAREREAKGQVFDPNSPEARGEGQDEQ
jgi:hypothetical protein